MFGSIFIGLGGMNAFSSALRQISNNITNINSTGFKSTDLNFANLARSDEPADASAGEGVALAAPRLDFQPGELRQTTRDLDLAVDGGDGFLVLLKDGRQRYLRTGGFEIDPDGAIVLAGTEHKLAILDESGAAAPVSVAAFRIHPPQKSTKVTFADNLSSTARTYSISNIAVFDAQGASDNWQARFERAEAAPPGEWSLIVRNGAGQEIATKTLRFINGLPDPATSTLTFEETSSGRSVSFDFSTGVTSFSSGEVSTLRVSDSDGFGVGEIVSVRANDQGVLEIAYSNEQTKTLGSIAIATFRDPQDLRQRESGLFEYQGSLRPELVTTQHDRAGRVLSRRIEASNVDLSREFGDLIMVQRGFQASSQVVSVSNDMIQQLFGIRGQG